MNGWMVLLIIAALLTGVGFAVRALKRKLFAAATSMSSLLLEGVPATARIDAIEKRRISRGQFEYFMTYAFDCRDGSEVKKELRIPATEFHDYNEGEALEIVYLPKDPSISATRKMVDKVRAAQHDQTGKSDM